MPGDPQNPQNVPSGLSDDTLDEISGGPSRRAHDHIGNFNFKVEIEGVTDVVKTSWETTEKIDKSGGGSSI